MKCVNLVILLSVAVTAIHARAYYDAIVVDADGRSEDRGEVTKLTVRPQDCFLPKSTGICRGYFPSYYYNRVSRKCEFFIWSGCRGNNNRFDSLESCQKQCPVLKVKRGSEQIVKRCNPEEVSPTCDKANRLTKDTYNRTTSKNVCLLPAVRGNCRALFPRWRYDPKAGKCTEFIFGGCNGNGNNFRTLRQCVKTCGGPVG